LLGVGDTLLDCRGERIAEKFPSALESDLLTNGEDVAVRRGGRNLVELGNKGNGLLVSQSLGIVAILDRQRRHDNPSLDLDTRQYGGCTKPRLPKSRGGTQS